LKAARGKEVNLVVQSFLIHNGINVFGELVCMPGNAKDMADVGKYIVDDLAQADRIASDA
jgi:hypothetical protein